MFGGASGSILSAIISAWTSHAESSLPAPCPSFCRASATSPLTPFARSRPAPRRLSNSAHSPLDPPPLLPLPFPSLPPQRLRSNRFAAILSPHHPVKQTTQSRPGVTLPPVR